MNLSLVAFFAVLSAFFGRRVRVAPWVRVRSPLGREFAVVLDPDHARALALPVPSPAPPDECAHVEESPAYVALLPVAARGSGFAQLPARALDLADLDVFLEAVPPVVRAVQLGEHAVDPHALRALLVALDGSHAKELTVRTVFVPDGDVRARRTRIEVAGIAWTLPGAVTRHALAYDPRLPAVVCCTACGERRGRGRTPRDALARALAAATVERETPDGLAHYCPSCAPPTAEHAVAYPDDDRDPLELAPPVRVGSGTHRVLSREGVR